MSFALVQVLVVCYLRCSARPVCGPSRASVRGARLSNGGHLGLPSPSPTRGVAPHRADVRGALSDHLFTSIPALWLYQPVLDDPAGYIAGAGHDNKILLGAFLELLLIISNIGTATVVFPLLKRVNEICAISYVTARVMECTFILVGILTMVTVVTLQRNPSAGTSATLGSIAYTLAAIKDWTFLFGPGFVVGIGNGLLLGYLMYRSELVPRRWPYSG